jgi:UDP-N-acetylglucosamine acyltransferase
VLPYSLVSAERNNHVFGVNKVGLQRRGFTPEQMRELATAMRLLTSGKKNTTQALAEINDMLESGAGDEHVKYLAEFAAGSERGVIK